MDVNLCYNRFIKWKTDKQKRKIMNSILVKISKTVMFLFAILLIPVYSVAVGLYHAYRQLHIVQIMKHEYKMLFKSKQKKTIREMFENNKNL